MMYVPQDAIDSFINGGYDSEEYLVKAIRRYPLSPQELAWLYEQDVSVEDMLNGRVEGEARKVWVDATFERWNGLLGAKVFGYGW